MVRCNSTIANGSRCSMIANIGMTKCHHHIANGGLFRGGRSLTQMNPNDRGFLCVGRTTTGKRCKNIPSGSKTRCHLHTSQKKYLRHNIVTLSDRDFNNLSKKVKTENRRRIEKSRSNIKLGQRVFTWQGWGKVSFIRYDKQGNPSQIITKLSSTGKRGKWTNMSTGVRKSKPRNAVKRYGSWEW